MIGYRLIAFVAIAACAPGFDSVRYRNQAPVTVVNDRAHTKEPAEIEFVKMAEYFDAFFYKRAVRATQVPTPRRSRDVNSMDEVPDSTWFRNRIGIRDVSLDEIRNGNKIKTDPMLNKPWSIKSTKVGGKSIGFIVEDSTGAKFVLKFDQLGLPEAETAADVISSRLVWAFGYHTADTYIVDFKRSDLKIAPNAKVKPLFGESKPLTEKVLDEKLAKVNIRPDGSIRGFMSRFIPGKFLGPWPRHGVRADDPNDKTAHELRRELRGSYTLFSWLDHVDMKADQCVDMYQPDPADKSVSYVNHFHIDFGKTLGVYAEADSVQYVGHSYSLDWADIFTSLVSLGAWKRPWEGRSNPGIVGVGIFDSKDFEPGHWKPVTPSYLPLLEVDRFDAFWGAKIIMRFTEPQIRAAVEEGRLSDPKAIDYLVRVLIERQRKAGRYWFDRVNPLDQFEVKNGTELCFDDLSVRYDLDRSAVSYRASAFDFDGRELGSVPVTIGERGRVCAGALKSSTSPDGYQIVRLETLRAGNRLPPTLVHLARDERSTLRVIGLRRL